VDGYEFAAGGGIYCSYSSPTIEDNSISGNSALDWAGGIGLYGSSTTIVGNTIMGNTSGRIWGGIGSWLSDPIIMGNAITGNIAAVEGGGIGCWEYSAIIEANIITGNRADVLSGGIEIGVGSFSISNNIITNNVVSSTGGGGILLYYASTTMNNNTIADNSAELYGGGLLCMDSCVVTIANTIFWNNTAATGEEICIGYYDPIQIPSTLTISYSDVEGGQSSVFVDKGCTLNWGGGMIDADPLFGSLHGFDYLLRQGSPCIDAGDPMIEDGLSDWHPRWPEWYPNGPRSDMGAYGGPGNRKWLAYREWGVPIDTNWRQLGFNAERTSYNPYEQQIGPSNVGDLEVLWTHGFSSSIRGGVSVVDGIAYYGTYGGEVYASDAATGTRIWTQGIMGKHQGQSVVDGVVYVTAANSSGPEDGMVYAFDALTGDPIWTWDPGARRLGGPLVSEGVVYVAPYYEGDPIQTLNAETGEELWSVTPGGNVAVANGVVYTNISNTLRALSSENGELLWTGFIRAGILTRPTVANGIVYMHTDMGYLYAFDASGCGVDSCSPLWAGVTEVSQQGDGPQSPAVGEGKVYVGSNDTFYAFDADGCGEPHCLPLWSTYTPVSFFSSSPSIANGVVYSTCDNNYIYAYEASTGDVLWQYYTSGGYPMRSSPTILDGRLFHGATFNYTLYAFALPY
jgi:parallel beta-helix repeat protein